MIGDYLGRRKAMMMGGATMILGVIIQVTSQPNSNPLAQFIIGRVITGIGNGINTSTIPTYQGKVIYQTTIKVHSAFIELTGGLLSSRV